VPQRLIEFAPDLIFVVDSRCPEDRMPTGPLWMRGHRASKLKAFDRDLGTLAAGGGARIMIVPDKGRRRIGASVFQTVTALQGAALSDPVVVVSAVLRDFGIDVADGPDATSPALEQLYDCVRGQDFSGDGRVARAVEGREGATASPFEADEPGTRATIANRPDPRLSRPGLPVSRYMAYGRAALKLESRYGLSDEANWFKFVRWYLDDGARRLRGAAPLAPEVADALNEVVPPPRPGWPKLTRLAAGEAADRDGDFQRSATAYDFAHWWLIDHKRARRYPACLTPDALIAPAIEVEAGQAGPFPLPRALVNLHAGSKTYRRMYDLGTESGRVGFMLDALLNLCDSPASSRLFEGPIEAWLRAPATDAPNALSRAELMMAFYAGMPACNPEEALDPSVSKSVRYWFRTSVCRAYPWFRRLSTASDTVAEAVDKTDFDLIGMAASETGLGANLWMSEQALASVGVEATILDSEAHYAEVPRRTPLESAPLRFRRNTALIHLNADVAPQVLCAPFIDRDPNLYAIAFLLWELETLPDAHMLALDMLDEIWCPSEFLSEVYRRHTDAPVRTMLKGIEIPDVAPMTKARMGAPEDAFCFMLPFDFHSSVERKNPLAGVRAFQRAFDGPGDGDVRLIVKTTEVVRNHWGDPNGQWPQIAAAAARDPRIVIVADKLPFDEMLAMIRGADCLLSPHRSEGFGYFPAYGLIYERPVIATDYSGSTGHLTAESSFPIRWTAKDVAPNETIFPTPGAFWADIDIDAMAAAMRTVRDQPEIARRRAEAGRRLMRETYSPAAQGARYLARFRELGLLEA